MRPNPLHNCHHAILRLSGAAVLVLHLLLQLLRPVRRQRVLLRAPYATRFPRCLFVTSYVTHFPRCLFVTSCAGTLIDASRTVFVWGIDLLIYYKIDACVRFVAFLARLICAPHVTQRLRRDVDAVQPDAGAVLCGALAFCPLFLTLAAARRLPAAYYRRVRVQQSIQSARVPVHVSQGCLGVKC